MSVKRKLTEEEIKFVLDFQVPYVEIPEDTFDSALQRYKTDIAAQLKEIEIYPALLNKLQEKIRKNYIDTLVHPGECVGVIVAQSIGERQTQSNLNTFHKAGSSDKQPVVSVFSDLLN